MESWDIKKAHKALYATKSTNFELVTVPPFLYLMVDGAGDPNTSDAYSTAVQTLYALSYGVRAVAKTNLGRVHTVSPLEGLWYASDLNDFITGNRDAWEWTMMIVQPEWTTPEMLASAADRARNKPGVHPELARLESLDEGRAVQILHIGPYRDEAPTIARLHRDYLPENGLVPRGHHHEIYLSDPRRTPPEKLKTILRQPVDRIS